MLLDTHAWVWLALEPARLSRAARAAIERAPGALSIASFSLYEVAVLVARRRIAWNGTPGDAVGRLVAQTRVAIHPLTEAIAARAAELPAPFPGDPGDRLIAATALQLAVPLLTSDQAIRASGLVTIIW